VRPVQLALPWPNPTVLVQSKALTISFSSSTILRHRSTTRFASAAVASSTINSGSSRQNSPAAESISSKEATFEEELAKHLRKHFKSEADTKKVISTFMAVYHRKLSALSLDDVERISRNYQETKELSF